MNASRSFTLLELLVVISVAAGLVGLLLPTISMVRASAQKASCQSRMRQIGLAISVYANDFDGALAPAFVNGAQAPTSWISTFGPHDDFGYSCGPLLGHYINGWEQAGGNPASLLQRINIFRCPGDTRRAVDGTHISMGMNITIATSSGVITKLSPDGLPFAFVALGHIPNCSNTVIVVDACGTRFHPGYSPIPPVPVISVQACVNGTGNWSIGAVDCRYNWTPWHRQGSNLFFLDGHCRHTPDPAAESAAQISIFGY